jgi:hypothetical protein
MSSYLADIVSPSLSDVVLHILAPLLIITKCCSEPVFKPFL